MTPLALSISTPGSGVTDEPVAMMIFFGGNRLARNLDRIGRPVKLAHGP
jgi:hypothetical protein